MADELSPKFVQFAKKLLPDKPVICDVGSRDALEGISLYQQLPGGGGNFMSSNQIPAQRKSVAGILLYLGARMPQIVSSTNSLSPIPSVQ